MRISKPKKIICVTRQRATWNFKYLKQFPILKGIPVSVEATTRSHNIFPKNNSIN
jgi:hypothetical protein